MVTLNARSDQRVGAIGRTRSGKTFIMGKLLEDQPRVIVVDSKHRVRWPGFYLTSDPDAALLQDKVIYRHDDKVPGRFWEQALDALAEKGGGVIYCDEMAELSSPNYAPPGLKTIFRLGGEIGVGCWWSAQESTGISNTVLRQSDILLLFLNTGASDRDKVIATAGDMGEVTSRLGLYEFVVFQAYGEAYDSQEIPVFKWQERLAA